MMKRLVLLLLFVSANTATVDAYDAGAFVERLPTIPDGKLLHVTYSASGKHTVTDYDTASSHELRFEDSKTELWLDPASRRFRKYIREHQVDMSEEKPSLLISEQDYIFRDGEILGQSFAPEQEFDVHIGNSSTVATSVFRDLKDGPIYCSLGLASLGGDLQFFHAPATADLVAGESEGAQTVISFKGEMNSKTEIFYDSQHRVSGLRFYYGQQLFFSSSVSAYQVVSGISLPSEYSYTQFGATEQDILEAGKRVLQTAEVVDSSAESFELSLVPGMRVLDDTDPMNFKLVDDDGQLVWANRGDQKIKWYQSKLLLLVGAGIVACLAFVWLRFLK